MIVAQFGAAVSACVSFLQSRIFTAISPIDAPQQRGSSESAHGARPPVPFPPFVSSRSRLACTARAFPADPLHATPHALACNGPFLHNASSVRSAPSSNRRSVRRRVERCGRTSTSPKLKCAPWARLEPAGLSAGTRRRRKSTMQCGDPHFPNNSIRSIAHVFGVIPRISIGEKSADRDEARGRGQSRASEWTAGSALRRTQLSATKSDVI